MHYPSRDPRDGETILEEEIMSKSLIRLTLIASACALAVPAQAQPASQKALTYKMITAVATGAVEACQAMGYQVSVTVVGRNGEIVAQIRGDGAAPHTMENSRRKAYTALTFGSPSSTFAKQIADPKNEGARQRATLPGIIGIGGGIPIMAGKEVLGAVGISGSPGKDDDCSQAGIDRIKGQL
jgi:uncharacterized protein GlcG (DUF336 family)